MYKLFEIKTKLGGDYIVLATSITNAADALNNAVEKGNKYNNEHYSDKFTIRSIELLSDEIEFDNNNDGHIILNDKYKRLIVQPQIQQENVRSEPETKYFDKAKAKELILKGYKISNLHFSPFTYIYIDNEFLYDSYGHKYDTDDVIRFWKNSPDNDWYIFE